MKFVARICGLVLSFGILSNAHAAPVKCSIQAFDGHYLWAVAGGGLGQPGDPIRSNASQPGTFGIFTIRPFVSDPSKYALQTSRGFFVTAVGGGGRAVDVVHTNATNPSRWEQFKLISLGNNEYAMQTLTGNYLTAQDSGGRANDVIHSNATRIGSWEKFRFNCAM